MGGMRSFGARLVAARKGQLLDDVAYHVRQHLPSSMAVSRETIRRMETGIIPESKANPVVVAALAAVYEVPVASLSKSVAADLDRLRPILTVSPEYVDGSHGGRYVTTNRHEIDPRSVLAPAS